MVRLLHDQVAVVTGAGSGIGRAIALRLAAEGVIVVICERDTESGQAAVLEIIERGDHAELLPIDIADTTAVRASFANVVEQHGHLDIVVNNAGITRRCDIFDVTEDDWDRVHQVNARGTFFCMQAAAMHMRNQGEGRIVNIASIAGKGYRGTSSVAYAASKGAVIAMTRIAAAQLGAHGVTVNAICPGVTQTNLVAGMGPNPELIKTIPIGRLNKPSDIAETALFLVSPGAENITGQSINVDGGLMWD